MKKKVQKRDSSGLKRIRQSTYNNAVNWASVTKFRTQAGLTKTEAGKAIGWSAQKWGDFEAGRRKNPRIGTLLAACKALGCEVTDLLKK